jgi:hypothetical protein
MKFYAAIFAHVVIGLILGVGIYQVMHGHLWLLIAGFVAYLVLLTKIGCLPPDESH